MLAILMMLSTVGIVADHSHGMKRWCLFHYRGLLPVKARRLAMCRSFTAHRRSGAFLQFKALRRCRVALSPVMLRRQEASPPGMCRGILRLQEVWAGSRQEAWEAM